jgi:adenosylhomocysteine nucleosidase
MAPALEIHLVGIGATQMPDLRHTPPNGIIMAGLAGALYPALRIGDVVIDDCPAEFQPSGHFRTGKITASKKLVSTPLEKRLLFEQTGALAVDMESAVVRAAAAEQNLPFVSIRAISDTADESLDPAILGMVDSFGQPRIIPLALALLRRPMLIPRLIRLGKSSNLAAKNLATVVHAIVHRWSAIELAPAGE